MQWKATGQCSRGDSCFSHGSNRGQKAQSSSLAPKTQTQNAGRRPPKSTGPRGRTSFWTERFRDRAKITLKESLRICRVIIGILPYVKVTNPNRDAHSATSVCSGILRLTSSPVKSGRKVVEEVRLLYWKKESNQFGCVSRDCLPRKSVLREAGKLGSNHTVQFSKVTWHHVKKSGKKGSIARCDAKV